MEQENNKKADESAQAANGQGRAAGESRGASKKSPPPATFASLVESLAAQALVQMGELADPASGKKEKNLQFARYMIDILEMIEEKTRGNLTENEREFLQAVLYDLRMRYVQASG